MAHRPRKVTACATEGIGREEREIGAEALAGRQEKLPEEAA